MIRPAVACTMALAAMNVAAGLKWDAPEQKIPVHPTQVSIETAFSYTNTGDTPVTITEIKSTCGCMVPQLQQATVAPGTRGELTVEVDLRGRSGHFRKAVMVKTDDGEETPLYIEADIPRAYEIAPVMMRWTEGSGREKKARLRNLNEQPVRLLSVSSSHQDLPAELKVIRDGYEYEVTVTRRSASEKARAVIRIETEPPPGMKESKTLKIYADAR